MKLRDRPMVHLKTPGEIDAMAAAGAIIGGLFDVLPGEVAPGVSTAAIDRFCEDYIRSTPGAVPAFKGLYGFPCAVCASLNEEVVHGIPSRERVLEEGDVVSVDVGVRLDGWYADSARTFAVGRIDRNSEELLEVTRAALEAAIRAARPGGHVGDLGAAVMACVGERPMGIIRDLVGHGIGRELHEEPQVPNRGRAGYGPLLREGMVLAVEPMISLGSDQIRTLDDGWTVVTADGTRSAHFEHTVAITGNSARVLTGSTRVPAGGNS
ncbi:MAG: type I methionyl aminopeptidase [Longimicrobiales bacterium]|nr:type I methionyl aminopeptidase [Longimicrobiales bacterium]